jgi:lipoprotein NlpD
MCLGLLHNKVGYGVWVIILMLVSACGGCGLAPAVTTYEAGEGHAVQNPPATYHSRSIPGYHSVKWGDTLILIAWRYHKDYRDLARWNGIAKPYRIYKGQRLRLVPPPGGSERSSAKDVRRPQKTAATLTRAPLRKTTTPSSDRGGSATSIEWQWPAQGKLLQSGMVRAKQGLEILGWEGQPIKAAAPGTVIYSGDGLRGYGKLIIIKHSPTYLSAYAHNSRLLVREGATVIAGQQIAEMGHTGTMHVKLYFEIRQNGKPVPPLHYLPKRTPDLSGLR